MSGNTLSDKGRRQNDEPEDQGGKIAPRKRTSASIAGALVLYFGFLSVVSAQQDPGLQRLRPQFERPSLPEFREEQVEPELTVPPQPEPRERLSTGLRVFIREIRIEGNTVISAAELSEVTRNYVGRFLDTEDLLRLRDDLTRYYVDRGYVSSGAIIPDQDVIDDVIIVRIVEGTLGEVHVGGLRWLSESFVVDRVAGSPGETLNVNELRDRLQLLNTDPSMGRLDARLGPTPRLGQSRLDLEVDEARWSQLIARTADDLSPSVGGVGGELDGTLRNVLGFSDPLRLRLTGAEGLKEASVSYSVPLTASDLRFYVSGQYADVDVVEEPFDELHITGMTGIVEGGFRYPILRGVNHEVALQLGLERIWSETRLLGEPFSFSPGVQNGKSEITAIRFTQEGQARDRDQVFAARSTVSFGIEALGATHNANAPDSRFISWLGQAQYARRLDDEGQQLVCRGDIQLTDQPLLPIEQFAIGGLDTVRGYRQNLLVRDNGWITSLEWRIPLFRLPLAYLSKSAEDGLLQFAPFVDAGGGWNQDRKTLGPTVLYSVGAGLRWNPAPGWFASVYYGKALKDVPNPENKNLQDYGVYFDVQVQIY